MISRAVESGPDPTGSSVVRCALPLGQGTEGSFISLYWVPVPNKPNGLIMLEIHFMWCQMSKWNIMATE